MAHRLLTRAIEIQRKTSGTDAAEGERVVRALVAMAEGRPAEGATLLEPLRFDSSRSEQVSLWSVAKFRAGDFASALKGFTFLDSPEASTQLNAGTGATLALRARALAETGQPGEARKTYQRLFDLWKDADTDVPLLVQARAEFEKLGS
jgi:hypothetical protein